jgi:malyl-CoA/(S)-citramalyl-CoA lyase
VAPDDKQQARENVIAALTGQDWSACSVSVRINGLDTHWCYRDIVEVVERAGPHLDTILIPKVGAPADVLFVATMLDQIGAAFGLEPINLHILIETALGMANSRRSRRPARSGWRRWCSASPTTRPPRRRAPPTSADPTPTT